MARERDRAADAAAQLAHPVYLDTPMLVSFLASLEGGVSYSSEVAERYAGGKEGEGEGSAKAGLPSIATLLGLNLSAEGRYKRRSSTEESTESKFVREHTSASLFNRLRLRLEDSPGAVVRLDSVDALSGIADGALVEMRGEVTGNPLKQLLDLITAVGPYLGYQIDEPELPAAQPTSSQKASRTGRRGKGSAPLPRLASAEGDSVPELTITDMFRILKREVERSPVLDLLIEGSGGVRAVLTASRELLSNEVEAYLIGGKFTVLAKLSAVVPAGESINLLRRSVFGLFGRKLAEQAFSEFNQSVSNSDDFNLSLAGTVIDGPVIQLLPLAIYL